MAAKFGDSLKTAKQIKSVGGDLKKMETKTQKAAQSLTATVSKLEKSVDKIKKAKQSDLKSYGWSKRAKNAGADKAVLAALANAEKKQTPKSCEAVLAVLKKNTALKDIAAEVSKELADDKKAAAAFNKATAAFQDFTKKASRAETSLAKQAKALAAAEKKLKTETGKVQKLKPQVKTLVKKAK